jgi:hypothetical protein
MPRAFTTLYTAQPRAVILTGVSTPVLHFIEMAVAQKWYPLLFFLSFDVDGLVSGMNETNLRYPGELFFTSVVPSPTEQNSTLAGRFRLVMANQTATIKPKTYQKPSFFGMEGFVSAQFVISVIKEILARGIDLTNLTTTAMLDVIYEKKFWEIEDETLGPFIDLPAGAAPENNGCNQGLHTVRLYRVTSPSTSELEMTWVQPGCGNVSNIVPFKKSNANLILIISASAGGGALVGVLFASGIVGLIVYRHRRSRKQEAGTRMRTRTATADKARRSQLKPLLQSKAGTTTTTKPFHM